jgi:hypothetical protein
VLTGEDGGRHGEQRQAGTAPVLTLTPKLTGLSTSDAGARGTASIAGYPIEA